MRSKTSTQKGGGLERFREAARAYNDLELAMLNNRGTEKTKRRSPTDKHRSKRRVAYPVLHWPGEVNIMH